MNQNTKALKSGFWYLFSNLIVRGITLITTPVFARLLTKAQYGDYSNYLAWTNIAVIIITMRMESSLISAKYDYSEKLEEYNRSVISLTALLTAVWALILNLFSGFFTGLFGFSLFYTNLMLVYCFFHAVISFFQMNERFQYRYKKSVFVGILVAVTTLAVSVILVVTMNDKLTGRVLGGVLPAAVIGFILLTGFFRNGKRVDLAVWRYVLKICLPYVPHLLSLQVLNTVDRIMITRICGSEDNAMYTIAYTCGHMVTILMTSMNSAFAPWLGDKLNQGEEEELKKVARYYMLLFGVLCLAMMLVAPEILLIMGGRNYLGAIYVMPPVAMGCVCQFLYTLYVNVEQFRKKTVSMAFASVAAAVLNYVLNIIFIPKYGYVAAAYTTLAGYLFLLMAHMLIVRRLKMSYVFDNRFTLLVTGVMFGITIGINYLYGNSGMRYIVIGIYAAVLCAVLIRKRKLVKKLLKKIIK